MAGQARSRSGGVMFVGLGGGLDVLNALSAMSLFAHANAKSAKLRQCILGSVRPRQLAHWVGVTPFSEWGGVLRKDAAAVSTAALNGRYAEPLVAEVLDDLMVDTSLPIDVVKAKLSGADMALVAMSAHYATPGAFLNPNTADDTASEINPGVAEFFAESGEPCETDDHRGILYFGRPHAAEKSPSSNVSLLASAFEAAADQFDVSTVMFVDGGGDSLILGDEDGISQSETTDPLLGGDAVAMRAYKDWSASMKEPSKAVNIVHAIVAVGLDIDARAFVWNLEELKRRGAYYGRINLATGETEDWASGTWEILIPGSGKLDFSSSSDVVVSSRATSVDDPRYVYDMTAERILRYQAGLSNDSGRFASHTATVAYHARNGHFGERVDTTLSWCPAEGVLVTKELAWMYFFDGVEVEQLKRDICDQDARRADAEESGVLFTERPLKYTKPK